jgi:L-ascorbate metabolism protein UlaG (beta-lactamase superfamily)
VMWLTYAKRAAGAAVSVIAVLSVAAVVLWRDRPSLDAIDWPAPAIASAVNPDAVTVTWLGVTTLLIDDGETQILIDGFFSRPSLAEVLFGLAVENDAAQIDYAMNEFRMRRLAAIIPVHSHYDHAMDIGAIANRSSASILGSESTAQIARGAGVPEDQITVIDGTTSFQFGNFNVTLRPIGHAPIGWRGSVPLDGIIEEPLTMPQPVSAWRMGGAYTIIIEHPQGTALVQGSASYKKYELQDVSADVVFLGVGQLDGLGRDYAELYWQHTVTATGSHSVYPIHFDDFSKPFGEITLPPRIINNFERTAEWLLEFRSRWDTDASLFMPEFGKPIAIFSQPASES